MSFLDKTGLEYFYSKVKQKFIQTVNSNPPDPHGNVNISQVPLAENLTSPDAQASVDSFVYRTSGGSASLDSGEANLVFINGNVRIVDRVPESWSATTTNNLECNVDNITKATWREQVTQTGNTTFTYYVLMPNDDLSEWDSTTHEDFYWSPTLSTYGLDNNVISNVNSFSFAWSKDGTGISAVTINPYLFTTRFGMETNSYLFRYQEVESQGSLTTDWTYNGEIIDLENCGINVTSTTLLSNDSITVNWTKGTPNNSTVTIHYVVPEQGSLIVPTPKAFQSTGANQFDKDHMALTGYTINSEGKIVENPNTIVCYCPAKGGDHGYAAVSLGNHIIASAGMGWSATVPAANTVLVIESDKEEEEMSSQCGRFTYSQDGYIAVVVDNASDLMMGCAWSDYINDTLSSGQYIAYTKPSQIAIPTYAYDTSGATPVRVNLQTITYGLPRLGNTWDTINFDAHTYIRRIGWMENDSSGENLTTVEGWHDAYGTIYDYDSENIFYVLDGHEGGSVTTYALATTDSYTSTEGAITAIDFTKFRNKALTEILNYDSILHDVYTFTNTGSSSNSWSYTWNDGTEHTQTFTFTSDWGITFGTTALNDTFTVYLAVDSVYLVDDHGTEKFVETNLGPEAELLYGQNLRDKLRSDVLTISVMNPGLNKAQIKQVAQNLSNTLFISANFNTSGTITVNDSRILDTMHVVGYTFSNGAALAGNFTWTTSDGSIQFTNVQLVSGQTTMCYVELAIINS